MVIGLINQQLANYGPMVPPELVLWQPVPLSMIWLSQKNRKKSPSVTLQQSRAQTRRQNSAIKMEWKENGSIVI